VLARSCDRSFDKEQEAMKRFKLDSLDFKILGVLQRDAKITNLKLADEIGLSASPCLERVKRLEKAGILPSYHARVEPSRVVPHIYAYVEVTLKQHERDDFRRFEKYAGGHRCILECSLISGNFDYVIKIVARDIQHFHAIMDEMMNAQIGLAKHFTYIVIKPVKSTAELPLDVLREPPELELEGPEE
jgi:Lrp/AsnC family transcriptional regulator, regulator of ectoine-degradation genes